MRKVKIVATIGPATANETALLGIVEAGVDVIRINGAHGDIANLANRVELVRKVAEKVDKNVGILVDLPGPKMRVGVIKDEEILLKEDDSLTIVNEKVIGTPQGISTTVKNLYSIVEKGDPIILADGQIRSVVEKIEGTDIFLKITTGGTLKSKKGFFLPNAEDKLTPFSEVDHAIVKASIDAHVDFLGLSFVRRGSDIDEIRAMIPKESKINLIAKIETRLAVDELPSILEKSDAIMVARGDLGIQLDITRVPLLQKEIIRACNQSGKPVITATEMLESMTTQPIPTRAEVGDVANAVLDGTDAVMLSGETAVGRYPSETVATMAEVALQAENWRRRRVPDVSVAGDDPVAWAVAHAVVQAAQDLDVKAILCPTRSGATARRIAAYRPTATIVGISRDEDILAQLSLIWGVRPIMMRDEINPDEEVEQIMKLSRKAGYIEKGDLVAVASGSQTKSAGGTDSIRIVVA